MPAERPTPPASTHDDDADWLDHDNELDAGAECGRWVNGRLARHCSKAGSEECDWICPLSGARADAP
jgi:hypothetical protein